MERDDENDADQNTFDFGGREGLDILRVKWFTRNMVTFSLLRGPSSDNNMWQGDQPM